MPDLLGLILTICLPPLVKMENTIDQQGRLPLDAQKSDLSVILDFLIDRSVVLKTQANRMTILTLTCRIISMTNSEDVKKKIKFHVNGFGLY